MNFANVLWKKRLQITASFASAMNDEVGMGEIFHQTVLKRRRS